MRLDILTKRGRGTWVLWVRREQVTWTHGEVVAKCSLERRPSRGARFAGAWILDFSTSCVCACVCNRVWLSATPGTVAHQGVRVCVQSCLTLCDPRNCSPPGSSNTGVCCHFLLQGLFPTQESNPCLLHWQADSLPLSHWEAPQPPEVWEISVCWLSLPVYGILLWWAELMKADR